MTQVFEDVVTSSFKKICQNILNWNISRVACEDLQVFILFYYFATQNKLQVE